MSGKQTQFTGHGGDPLMRSFARRALAISMQMPPLNRPMDWMLPSLRVGDRAGVVEVIDPTVEPAVIVVQPVNG